MRLKTCRVPIVVLCGLLFLTACNLGTSVVPPTLMPRPSATPLATMGVAPLSPNQLLGQAATSTPSANIELSILAQQIQVDRLMSHIDTLQNFHTRHVNSSYSSTTEGIGAAYNYILGQFQLIQSESEGRFSSLTQDFPVSWSGKSSTPKNIVGMLQGTEVGRGVIVLGAHYDSRIGNLEDGYGYAPGANDNGSGIAALIEIARILSQKQRRATVLFVAFSAEEEGRLGSLAFVHDFAQTYNLPITAMINLDIIGSTTAPDGSINDRQIRLFAEGPDSSLSRQLARDLELINFNYFPSLQFVVQEVDDRSGSYGDQLSFSNFGYAAVRFTEMNEEPQRRHTERDTIDDVQAGYLLHVTQSMLTVVTVLADGPRPPQNVSLRNNDDGTRRLTWEIVPDASSYLVALRPVGSLTYQQFEVANNFIDWNGFVPDQYASVDIVSKDAQGLMGPPSIEHPITN